MLRKFAEGVYWTEDADGLPAALVTTLDDGVTSLRAAEQWWAAAQSLLEWSASDAGREWVERHRGHGRAAAT